MCRTLLTYYSSMWFAMILLSSHLSTKSSSALSLKAFKIATIDLSKHVSIRKYISLSRRNKNKLEESTITIS